MGFTIEITKGGEETFSKPLKGQSALSISKMEMCRVSQTYLTLEAFFAWLQLLTSLQRFVLQKQGGRDHSTLECAGKTSGRKVPQITQFFNGTHSIFGGALTALIYLILSPFILTVSSTLWVTWKETRVSWGLSLPSLMIDKPVTFFILRFLYPCKMLSWLGIVEHLVQALGCIACFSAGSGHAVRSLSARWHL